MPDWKKLTRERFAALGMRPADESDLVEEVAQHLEDFYRELRAGGANETDAHREAMAELDDMHPLRAGLDRKQIEKPNAVVAGEVRPANFFDDLWRDVRYAMRTMAASPMFVIFVVLTLGLGIGANTTVFTVINTLILNPLPVPEASKLYALTAAQQAGSRASNSTAPQPMSYADLKDYAERNDSFQILAGYTSPRLLTWRSQSSSERMFNEYVTDSYFTALGLKPVRGRFFAPGEDRPGDNAVAVMNYGTWQSRFGGSDDVVGKVLQLNNVAVTVIGVAPRHFIGVNSIFGPDFWIPASFAKSLLPVEMRNVLSDRNKNIFLGIGRLKPGIADSAAQANLQSIAAALAREYPQTNEGRTVVVRPVSEVMFSSASSGSSPVLFGSAVLLVVVAIILLIACSNVANLLLARSARREQEIAVRLAMGASRGRLMRQLLTESVLLGILSGLLGVSIGYASLHFLWMVLPSAANFIAPKFDATVFLFALLVSLATGFLFGTIPAFQASRGNVAEILKESSNAAGHSRRRVNLANVLLVGQIAFSFLLLVTAALFLRSISRAYDMDPGFQTHHLALFMTNAGQTGYSESETRAFYKEARERVERLPDIASVTWSSNLPLWARSVNRIGVEGHQQRSQSDHLTAIVHAVDLHYFETSGIAIERGRDFNALDQRTSIPVAIINEKMAQDLWPGSDPIGRRIQLPDETEMRQIVAVAKTATYTNLGEPAQYCVYVPLEQRFSDAMTLLVRSKGDPHRILMPVQREVRAAGPGIIVSDQRTGRELIDNGLFQAKVGVMLLSVFGLIALGLACVGLYGIMAYSVSQRKREIGLRMALGAERGTVVRLILKQGMTLVIAGMLIGLVGALAVGRLLGRLLYGISAGDPISVLGAALVLIAVAVFACYLPARFASLVDPLVALREG